MPLAAVIAGIVSVSLGVLVAIFCRQIGAGTEVLVLKYLDQNGMGATRIRGKLKYLPLHAFVMGFLFVVLGISFLLPT
jgi:hypothetical protein